MKKSCNCIIPFYNEEQRIENVLQELSNIPYFDQIILVNDWSTDTSQQLVESFIKKHKKQNILLISYAKNKWKSHAVYEGLQVCHTDYVFLFDADIRNIQIKEIEVLIENMYKNPDIDMWILRRVYAKRYIKILYRELILSGQRMLRTTDLKCVFQEKVDRYQLEVAINTYMYTHKKTTVRSPYSGNNTFKSEKRWVIDGRKRNVLMYKDILGYQWTANFLKHTFFFRPYKLEKYKTQTTLSN